MVASNNRHHFSDYSWDKNGANNKPEPEFNNIRTVHNDHYLKGFLVGFGREIDRSIQIRIKEEEKKNKKYDVSLSEVVLRKIISDIIAGKIQYKLKEMRPEIEFVKDDRI